jgi:hypothetical protein
LNTTLHIAGAVLIVLSSVGCEQAKSTSSDTPQAASLGQAVPNEPSAPQPAQPSTHTLVAAPSTPSDAPFRVMSWNLEWFYDDEPADNYSNLAKEQSAPSRAQWDWKRDSVASAISVAKPSIAAFQEVENRRVLWYLTRALSREHSLSFREICLEGDDVFTEQDVGFVYRTGGDAASRSPLLIEPVLASVFGRTTAMMKDSQTAEVSKHVVVEYEVTRGDVSERVTIANLHLRAREEAVAIRTKQARTMHAWLADKIRSGENVIALGDFNTEEIIVPAAAGTDMHAVCGQETPDADDDLYDLHEHLAAGQRQTHLLNGKAFDRILVSKSLLEDAPDRVDLVFTKIERLKDLAINGAVDQPDEHWNGYWQMDDAERDISDHWPIMATFEFK